MPEVKMPDQIVASEFASVSVSFDHRGNGPRLVLRDLREDRTVYLDALALATLVWLPDGVLESWHDPALRWRESGASPVGDPNDRAGEAATPEQD